MGGCKINKANKMDSNRNSCKGWIDMNKILHISMTILILKITIRELPSNSESGLNVTTNSCNLVEHNTSAMG